MSPRIVIAGGGVAGWLTAAILARKCGAGAVSVIDEGGTDLSLGPFGDGIAGRPDFPLIAEEMGWGEPELLRATRGCYALGTAFDGWAGAQRSWFLPYGASGAPIGSVGFHHLSHRLRSTGRVIRHGDYSLAALAAQAERFTHPSSDPASPLSSYDYGLHLDGTGLADFIRQAAGVERIEGLIERVEHRADGGIAALRVAGGRRIAGDLFVDCSGPAARLIGTMPGARLESWRAWLPCDRVIVRTEADNGDPAPYVHHVAHDAGWLRHLPLSGAHAIAMFYASNEMNDAVAEASMDAPSVSFEPGRQAQPWIANCVAIGGAAAMTDPLLGLDLQLVPAAARRLADLLPHSHDSGVEAPEYNRITATELDHVRDVSILPWKTNGRHGQRLWDRVRAMDVPDTLAHRIALYRSRGQVVMYDEEPLDRQDWVAMFEGQGVLPRRYDPLADAVPIERISAHMERLRAVLTRTAAAMPRHVDYLGGTA